MQGVATGYAVPQQTTVVCPKPTDAQIQAQIENMRWQEKENSLNNAFNRQQQQLQLTIQQRQIQIDHEHYVVEHVVQPLMLVLIVAIIAFTVIQLGMKSIAAGIQKNKDDNAADVVEARRIIDKHESSE